MTPLPGTSSGELANERPTVQTKSEFDYLVKYRGQSLLHVVWLSSEEIEALSSKGRQALTKYLNGLTKVRYSSRRGY